MPRTRRLLSLTCALLIALPGTALAGGAGDDQYEDPFGDEPAQSEPDLGESTPEVEPAAPSETEAQDGAAAPAAPSASSAAPATLPRTGADASLAALGGGALLLAGLALRRRTADGLPD